MSGNGPSNLLDPYEGRFVPAAVGSTEGARTDWLTCLTCGATVTTSMDVDSLGIHHRWHATSASGDRS